MTSILVVSLCLSSLFVSALVLSSWMSRSEHRRQLTTIERSHERTLEAFRAAAEQTVTAYRSLLEAAQEALREAEVTARANQEQMGKTLQAVTSTICQTLSPPPPPASTAAGVSEAELRLAQLEPWRQMVHPEEARELAEDRMRLHPPPVPGVRGGEPPAGWTQSRQEVLRTLLEAPQQEAMAGRGPPEEWAGFDPSL